MKKIILTMILMFSFLYSQGEEPNKEKTSSSKADCLILKDENSIVCKYSHERVQIDKEIKIQWIDPNGKITRERSIIIPAGHGSIYDFRYIEGRMKGQWQFKVFEESIETVTTFEIN